MAESDEAACLGCGQSFRGRAAEAPASTLRAQRAAIAHARQRMVERRRALARQMDAVRRRRRQATMAGRSTDALDGAEHGLKASLAQLSQLDARYRGELARLRTLPRLNLIAGSLHLQGAPPEALEARLICDEDGGTGEGFWLDPQGRFLARIGAAQVTLYSLDPAAADGPLDKLSYGAVLGAGQVFAAFNEARLLLRDARRVLAAPMGDALVAPGLTPIALPLPNDGVVSGLHDGGGSHALVSWRVGDDPEPAALYRFPWAASLQGERLPVMPPPERVCPNARLALVAHFEREGPGEESTALWRVSIEGCEAIARLPGRAAQAAFDAASTRVAAADGASLVLWSEEAGVQRPRQPVDRAPIVALRFARSGDALYLLRADATLELWRSAEGRRVAETHLAVPEVDGERFAGVGLSPEGRWLSVLQRGKAGRARVQRFDLAAAGPAFRRECCQQLTQDSDPQVQAAAKRTWQRALLDSLQEASPEALVAPSGRALRDALMSAGEGTQILQRLRALIRAQSAVFEDGDSSGSDAVLAQLEELAQQEASRPDAVASAQSLPITVAQLRHELATLGDLAVAREARAALSQESPIDDDAGLQALRRRVANLVEEIEDRAVQSEALAELTPATGDELSTPALAGVVHERAATLVALERERERLQSELDALSEINASS